MQYRLDSFTTLERVKKTKESPPDTILVQISAVAGIYRKRMPTLVHLHPGGRSEDKFAAVQVLETSPLLPRFLYVYLASSAPYYLPRLATGLNLQMEALASWPIAFPVEFT